MAKKLSECGDSKCFFNSSNKYKEISNAPDVASLLNEWKSHESDLIKRNRYFNKNVESYFKEIFFEITNQDPGMGKGKIISKINPLNYLFRARSYKNSFEFRKIVKNPFMEIYPPVHSASTSGRMNAQGVEMLYLANSLESAYAEVDRKKCLIAKFLTSKTLNIFDVTKINRTLFDEISPLDSNFDSRLKCRGILLEVVPEMLRKPIDGLDYVMTQAFCNFVATWEGWGETKIHGLAYESVKHTGGKNYVIFEPHEKLIKRKFSIESIYKVAHADRAALPQARIQRVRRGRRHALGRRAPLAVLLRLRVIRKQQALRRHDPGQIPPVAGRRRRSRSYWRRPSTWPLSSN